MLKRISLVLVLAVALTLAFGGVAYANFGPHGGYADDTDACAGCHRAHTSFATITWTDDTVAKASHSALLISDAANISEFCYACHGDAAPGASTNVVSGVFDGGPSAAVTDTPPALNAGVVTEYATNSTFDATLNGGGFDRMPAGTVGSQTYNIATSNHGMDLGALTMPAWGNTEAGAVGSSATFGNLTCTSCHDVHGSSNYRILKDQVNGVAVGGYDDVDGLLPNPFVWSAEENYPSVGWKKHEAGAAQMAIYKPNYTTAEYRNKFGGNLVAGYDREGDISGWCSACHGQYIERNDTSLAYAWSSSTTDYGEYIQNTIEQGNGFPAYELGGKSFHRHPVNVTLTAGDSSGYGSPQTSWLRTAIAFDSMLPVEMADGKDDAAFRAAAGQTAEYTNYLGCLTCHRAHGSSAEMTGYAAASLESTNGAHWYPVRTSSLSATVGVDPTFDSALLRAPNRGVCERCHNK
jgi:predicted CXXCH cytochrome family protein